MTRRQLAVTVGGSIAVALVVGTGGLFFVFLFAYGFADSVGLLRHSVFLLGVLALVGMTTALAAGALRSAAPDARLVQRVARRTVAAAYGIALGAGVLVSMAHEDQNSVTADQPDAPFVILVVLCLLVAAVAVADLVRTYRRDAVSRG